MAILSFNDYLHESKSHNSNPKFKAGVAIIYDNKILLVHSTGASWKKGSCGIPKGIMEEGEDPLETALRELKEETGISLIPDQVDPSSESVDIYDTNDRFKHTLIYFVCRIEDLSEIGLDSERVPTEQLQLEEIDWAKFVSPEEAYPITARTQLIILDRHLRINN